MGETQRLNTGRSSEFADQAGGGGTSPGYDIKSVVKVDGNLSSLNPLTGSTINFTTGRDGVSFFSASFWLSGFQIFVGAVLTIVVDGVSYTLAEDGRVNGAGSDRETQSSVSGSLGVNLSAGSHTAYLSISNSGLGIVCSAGNPITLTVIYPTVNGDVATASPLTKQQTGPFGPTTFNPALADTYDPIPSSSTSVVLSATQTVMLLAYATFVDPGSNSINAQLGVRVTSPGPSVVDYSGSRISGGNDVNAEVSMLSRAVQLGAGTHTIELIAKSSGGGSYRYENAFLTVVYTVPQAVQPAPFSLYQTAVRTAGDDTSFAGVGVFNDVAGPVEVTVVTVGGDVIVEVQGAGETEGGGAGKIGLGLKVDGVEQATSPGFTPMGQSGTDSSAGSVGYKYLVTGLSAGSHTFRLTKVRTGTANNIIYATTGKPLRMFVWYN